MKNQYCAYLPSAPKPSPPPAAQTDPTHKSYCTLLNSSTKSLQQIRIIKKLLKQNFNHLTLIHNVIVIITILRSGSPRLIFYIHWLYMRWVGMITALWCQHASNVHSYCCHNDIFQL